MRADYELNFDGGCLGVVNDDEMVDRFIESSKKILKEDEIQIRKNEIVLWVQKMLDFSLIRLKAVIFIYTILRLLKME